MNECVDNDVEIIDTKVKNTVSVDAEKCKHCLSIGKWQTMIRAKCHHIPTEFLLDSGASLNVLSSQFLAKIPSKCVEKLSKRNIIIHGVANFETKVESQVRLTFSVNGVKFTDDFHVIPNNFNILGNPFLKKNKAIINFDTNEVTLNDSKFSMHTPSTRSTTVKTVSDLVVAAFSIQEIRVKLNKRITSDNMLVTGLNSVEQRFPGLTIVPAMVNTQNTMLRVVNENNTPVCISSQTALAIARNFNPNAITQFADFYEECESDSAEEMTGENDNFGNDIESELPDTCPSIGLQINTADNSASSCTSQTGFSCHHCQNTDCQLAQCNDQMCNRTSLGPQVYTSEHGVSDSTSGSSYTDPPIQATSIDAVQNVSTGDKPGGYYKCTQGSTQQPNVKLPTMPPQCDSDMNDPSEPYDSHLKFNIENDNFSSAEIKDFEIFLFTNGKRFSVTRAGMGYNAFHPHIVDPGDENPSNMRKCRYYRLKFQIQIQNSLLLPIYIVLIFYDDMDTMYMYFSGTIS